MGLSVPSRILSDAVVIDMPAKFWLLNVPLCQSVVRLLDDGHRYFVLNLSEVEFVDNLGIGQLISVWTTVKDKGGRVSLVNPSRRVRIAMQLTQLCTLFEVFEDEAAALQNANPSVAD
jgi:anti-sigma B factor antagonist